MQLTIDPVAGAADLRRFIGLPPRLYRGMPGYQPPLRMDRNLILHPSKGGFFDRGKVQYWLARRGDELVGRISAQIGPDAAVGMPEGTGMFGCLDTIDDRDVVARLLRAAEGWLRQQGCSHASGPFLLDINGEPGLMIDGFEEPPMTMTPWHPAYLKAHVEAAGYDKWRDVHSWKVETADYDVTELRDKLRIGQRRRNITVRALPKRMSRADLSLVCDMYNDAWQNNWGFVPLVLDDLVEMNKVLVHYLPAPPVRLVEIDGEPAAVMMGIPNLYEVTDGINSDPSPLEWLRLGWRTLRYRPKSGRIILLGIASRLRHSAVGAAIVMMLMDDMLDQKVALKPEWIEAGWVLENNDALTQILERFGFWRNKTFRIFGKQL